MFTRVVTLSGVEDVDAALAHIQEIAVPALRSQTGYKGLSISVDRAAGVVGTMSVWASEADRDASESGLAKLRDDAAAMFAADMKVDSFEEQVVEVSTPPAPGASLMVTRISMDPEKIGENLARFQAEVLPQIKATPGFRTLRTMMNTETGEGIVGSVWDDDASMQAAAEAAMARRVDATARGVNFGATSFREIIFIEMV